MTSSSMKTMADRQKKSYARRVFTEAKSALKKNPELQAEVCRVWGENVKYHHPTLAANRFEFGAVNEELITIILRNAGYTVKIMGHDETGFDLSVSDGLATFSVKSSAAAGSPGYIISNGRGGAGQGLKHDTLIISTAAKGIIYVPRQSSYIQSQLVDRVDHTFLPGRVVNQYSKNYPKNCIPLTLVTTKDVPPTESPFTAIDRLSMLSGEDYFNTFRELIK